MDAVARANWPELIEFDREHVWHPYAAMPGVAAPLPVVSARGTRLRLADGRELIDGMASWWCAIHGHAHPAIVAAIQAQAERMPHVMFGGLTHAPGIDLARRLLELTPPRLDRVFFADSGSVAVEVALKLCLQYWNGRRQPRRTKLLTVRGGYHGDTFGAMAICDPVQGMHRMFREVLPQHLFAPRPPAGFDQPLDRAWADEVEATLAGAEEEVAAIVVEPIVQGAGGMHFYSPACLRFLRELCDRHGLLLVLDEIATGFGRSGALFACDHAGVEPDVMCLGKALTGGAMTLAATLTTEAVAAAVRESDSGALMHGPTFMANPLACVAALASLALLEDEDWEGNVARSALALSAGLEPARNLPGVADVRVLGAIGVIELEQPVDLAAATAAAVGEGVWLRPFGRLVYAMPPYVADDEELAAICRAMIQAAAA